MARAIDQHRIAVAEESISIRDRMAISIADRRHAGERRHQHQECRAGQVEIRDQAIGNAKHEARGDEDVGFGRPRGHPAVLRSARFQRAKARRADRNDPPTGGQGIDHDPRRAFGNIDGCVCDD